MTNPFLDGTLAQEAEKAVESMVASRMSVTSEELRRGREILKGVNVGDIVTVSWKVDDAYGGGTKSHTGVVNRVDDWLFIEQSDRSPGHLRLPVAALHHLHVERRGNGQADANPFMALQDQSNPFLIL